MNADCQDFKYFKMVICEYRPALVRHDLISILSL